MTPIVTAICSYGMSGKVFHAPFLHFLEEFQFYGCLERSNNNSLKDYPYLKHFKDYDLMLQDEAIELVIVNTPTMYHFEMSKKALEAGKNVLVEKPFTVTSEEAKELIDIAKNNGVIITVYHNRRFDCNNLTVQEIIKSNE